ncbi:MAG: hypothetical protein WC076_07540 [Terrimicrobiaceae bacterium]|jgi:hypothetical protein|nr:hypothetical protein [Terrimicrobiaceae bacterium]
MILSIASTQFVFLALGMLALNVLLKAGGYAPNVAGTFPPLALALAHQGLWLFCVPLAWIAFATACAHFKNAVLNDRLARATGVAIAAAIFATYVYAGSRFF